MLALAVAAAGCSGDDGPGAKDAAARLARGLAAERTLHAVTAGMGRATPKVAVGDVTEQGDTATATLHWSWTLPGSTTPWAYDVRARLTKKNGAWSPRITPDLVAPTLTAGETLRLAAHAAPRADILGASGALLVSERPVVRYGIDKAQVPAAQALVSARALAGLLGIDAAAFVKRVAAAGPKAFVEGLVVREGEEPAGLTHSHPAIPGIGTVTGTLPLAPTHDFARSLLGSVGEVTAEIVTKSKGVYAPGDQAGLSGLELRYDEQLRGTPGVTVSAVDPKGASRTLFTAKPVPGKPLRTTLDPRLQTLAEQVLAGTGPAAALVAVRPSDGHLLVAANGPGSAGYATATVGRYAPGSTFKVVSSLALLRSGLTPDSVVPCTRALVVDGKKFTNYSDYPASGIGRIPLRTAVADSCNTAFISQEKKVDSGDLARAAASLGLGVDHDLGFPVFFGSVPAASSETGHAASMIGQGTVLASPFAMATVVASVAAGRTVVPLLLPDASGDRKPPGPPLKPGEAASLRTLMRGVVTSGSGALLGGLPGAPVLAKTGTAEFGDKVPPQTHAWMVAVHGDLAVAVFVDVGESGSHTAGPLLLRFLRGA